MKSLTAKWMVLTLLMSFAIITPVFADSNEVVALQNQVNELSQKLSNLERQLRNTPSAPSGYVAPSETGSGLIRVAEDINMGGHVDTQWNNNFHQPATASAAAAATNVLRGYDRNDGSFTVNAAELYFEKKAENAGDAGFRIDTIFGEDSVVTNADGDGDKVDLQQAYVEYNAPLSFLGENDIISDKLNIKAGRYATLAGFEVIEGPANWNISRSFLFNYAVPFNHTGVRTNFQLLKDFFDVYAGLNNGWDNPIDNNSAKTVELGLGYKPLDKVSLFHTIYWGDENNGANGSKRFLNTNTASVDVTDKLTLAGELSLGNDSESLDTTGTTTNPYTAEWHGFAYYTRYKFSDKFAMTYRGEWFRDENLYRTTLTDTLFEQTLTAEYLLTENLIARGEFRWDKANDDSIYGANKSSWQSTLGAQLIYVI